jgi:hypothetical protein
MNLYEATVLVVIGGLFVTLSLIPVLFSGQDYDSLVQTKE